MFEQVWHTECFLEYATRKNKAETQVKSGIKSGQVRLDELALLEANPYFEYSVFDALVPGRCQ